MRCVGWRGACESVYRIGERRCGGKCRRSGNFVTFAAEAGKPVAMLVAYRGPARPRTPGSMAGEIWIAPDFDSLPEDIADAFGMKEPSK